MKISFSNGSDHSNYIYMLSMYSFHFGIDTLPRPKNHLSNSRKTISLHSTPSGEGDWVSHIAKFDTHVRFPRPIPYSLSHSSSRTPLQQQLTACARQKQCERERRRRGCNGGNSPRATPRESGLINTRAAN